MGTTMNETGMNQGSGTQVSKAMEQKKVELIRENGEKVTTNYSSNAGNRYAVRASDANKVVVVRVNTELLTKQKKIAEANASIRRRSRS
jgi:hypothetical protein